MKIPNGILLINALSVLKRVLHTFVPVEVSPKLIESIDYVESTTEFSLYGPELTDEGFRVATNVLASIEKNIRTNPSEKKRLDLLKMVKTALWSVGYVLFPEEKIFKPVVDLYMIPLDETDNWHLPQEDMDKCEYIEGIYLYNKNHIVGNTASYDLFGLYQRAEFNDGVSRKDQKRISHKIDVSEEIIDNYFNCVDIDNKKGQLAFNCCFDIRSFDATKSHGIAIKITEMVANYLKNSGIRI